MQSNRTLTLNFCNNKYCFNVLPKSIDDLATKSFSKTSKKIKKFFYTAESGQRVNLVTDQDLKVFYETPEDKQLIIEGRLGESDQDDKEQKFDMRSWMVWMKQKAPTLDSEFLNLLENPERFPCEECQGMGSIGKRDCSNCYGTGSRPIKSMWRMIMKVIDYKIHYHLFSNISNFLDMWQNSEKDKEKTTKSEVPNTTKLQDNLSYHKNWSAGAVNQFIAQNLDFQDPFASSRPKTPQQKSFGPFQNVPITGSLPLSSNIAQANFGPSLITNNSSSIFSGNYQTQSRYDPTTKYQHYSTQKQPDSFLSAQNGKQDSTMNELNTYTQKKIEYSVLNENHKDFVIIKSNRTFTLRLENKNDFDWDYSLVLEIQGVINKSIKLNKKIHPGETLSLTIADLDESTKDGKIVFCFKGKDEIDKIKYYSEKFTDFSIRFV